MKAANILRTAALAGGGQPKITRAGINSMAEFQ